MKFYQMGGRMAVRVDSDLTALTLSLNDMGPVRFN